MLSDYRLGFPAAINFGPATAAPKYPERLADIKLGEYKRLAARLIECRWKCMLTILLQYLKNKTTRADKQVVVLGGVQVPEGFMDLLEKGPKFAVPTSLPTHELIGINRDLSSRATQENSERCLLEGVDCLQKCLPRKTLARKDR
ncbi:hypothetical protein HPB50_007172 [Hyalomma asiaticum]|uniref:Uncharacterized protein n=1 Tax=Hyalomma asiaticum TaxID=266040 RepID=A0ACB7SCD1_HYAAI|nr:hypothetical protein HPB50_007172 [Hyalomma asiaticum]